jgi:hypothetical protein
VDISVGIVALSNTMERDVAEFMVERLRPKSAGG